MAGGRTLHAANGDSGSLVSATPCATLPALELKVGSPLGHGTSGQVSPLLGAIDGGRYAVKEVRLPRTDSSDVGNRSAADISAAIQEVRLHRRCSAGCDAVVRYVFAHIVNGPCPSLLVLMEACDAVLWDALSGTERWAAMLEPGSSKRLLDSERRASGADLCAAVRHCHTLRVLHRDVNPWNIFLTRTPCSASMADHCRFSVRLGDFGLAVALPSGCEELEGLRADGAVELDDSALGSLYSAPELGKTYGFPADVFSVGMTLLALWADVDCDGDEDSLVRIIESAKDRASAGQMQVLPLSRSLDRESLALQTLLQSALGPLPAARPIVAEVAKAAISIAEPKGAVSDAVAPPSSVFAVAASDSTAQERLMAVFRRWDKEGVGRLPQGQLLQAFEAIGLPHTAIVDLLSREGLEHDGLVNYEDFVAWLFK